MCVQILHLLLIISVILSKLFGFFFKPQSHTCKTWGRFIKLWGFSKMQVSVQHSLHLTGKHLQGNSGLPTSSLSYLPLPPFLCLHSCETQQDWRQLRDEHVWTPQCSREDPPNLKWREIQLQKTVQFTVCVFLSMLYSFTNTEYGWPVSSTILNVFVRRRGGHHTT